MDNLGEYVLGCLLGCDVFLEVDRVVHWLVGGLEFELSLSQDLHKGTMYRVKKTMF